MAVSRENWSFTRILSALKNNKTCQKTYQVLHHYLPIHPKDYIVFYPEYLLPDGEPIDNGDLLEYSWNTFLLNSFFIKSTFFNFTDSVFFNMLPNNNIYYQLFFNNAIFNSSVFSTCLGATFAANFFYLMITGANGNTTNAQVFERDSQFIGETGKKIPGLVSHFLINCMDKAADLIVSEVKSETPHHNVEHRQFRRR